MARKEPLDRVLPVNILRGIIPTATLWDGLIGFAYLDDGGAFTDDTTDANSAGANDVSLMPAVPVLNDAFYFGENFATSQPFNTLKINLGTAGVGGTVAWEYYTTEGVWAAISVTDATNGFTTAGTALYVTWTIPADVQHVAVNGQDRYWIRARVLTAFAPIPLATQIWVGRYPTSLANITDGNLTTGATTATILVPSSYNGALIQFDLGASKRVLIGGYVGFYSSAGTETVYAEGFVTSGQIPQQSPPLFQISSATEVKQSLATKIVEGRYIVFRFIFGATTTANVNIYSLWAYELGL